jgi:uncharacterized Zn-finger protein
MFAERHTLIKHLRMHSGERPFACEHCGSKFNQSSNLQDYLRRYCGNKPWTCNPCGERLVLKQELIQHLRVHTGEKPFECEVCHKQALWAHAPLEHPPLPAHPPARLHQVQVRDVPRASLLRGGLMAARAGGPCGAVETIFVVTFVGPMSHSHRVYIYS